MRGLDGCCVTWSTFVQFMHIKHNLFNGKRPTYASVNRLEFNGIARWVMQSIERSRNGTISDGNFQKCHLISSIDSQFFKESRRQLIAPISFLRKTQQGISLSLWLAWVAEAFVLLIESKEPPWLAAEAEFLESLQHCVWTEAIRRNDADLSLGSNGGCFHLKVAKPALMRCNDQKGCGPGEIPRNEAYLRGMTRSVDRLVHMVIMVLNRHGPERSKTVPPSLQT